MSPLLQALPERIRPLVGHSALAAASLAAVKAGGWVNARRTAVAHVDPQLRHWRNYLVISPTGPVSLKANRRFMVRPEPPRPGVSIRTVQIPSPFTSEKIPADLYEPKQRTADGALLWIHGGGTISGSVDADRDAPSRLAVELGVPVLAVDYRRAPEHPFPIPMDDCFQALLWIHEHAEELGINRDRVAVGGDSAGGLLAASVAQRAHDEQVPLCFQALVYPMLDDRTNLYHPRGRGQVGWSLRSNKYAWSAYLRRGPLADEPRPYAVPSRRRDLSGLAPAWIGVGSLDLFFEEDVEYAERLMEAGVPCELVTVPGMYHSADRLVPQARASKAFTASFTTALARAVSGQGPRES